MLPALLHGKLSQEQENMEDLLTSSVFGLLQYVPPEEGLLKLLSRAVSWSKTPLVLLPIYASAVRYEFWPWLQSDDCIGAEPDLLVTVDGDGMKHIVLIEAKYHSAKSSIPDWSIPFPTDQLAKEWDNLVCLAKKQRAVPHLVYLTNDFGFPAEDVSESESEFAKKRPGLAKDYPFQCWWLSWRHLSVVFKDSSHPILVDLFGMARQYGFAFFEGFSPAVIGTVNWSFAKPSVKVAPFSFNQPTSNRVTWSFKP